MAVSTVKATFSADAETVWKTVTALNTYAWRSDLSKIDVLNNTQFTEYTKEGYPTVFTITACQPGTRWELDMENANMKGHWIGVFASKGGQTEIVFTEDVIAKKAIMKPFVKGYLKKQQKKYLFDLQKAFL